MLAGYVDNLRARRRQDGGAVFLVDAGDLFQGTLESNLGEGGVVVAAYNAVGYTAATIGNHEFDFGPEGDAATASPGQDPRGALKARAREANFPFLTANVIDDATGAPLRAPQIQPSLVVEEQGVRVAFIGVTTEETPRTTLAANFRGLRMKPVVETIREEAQRSRAAGASVIVVLAHAGGKCRHCDDPNDLTTCAPDEEIFAVARALPPGLVDVIVAGHTHSMVAHRVNGVAIIESWALGSAFGRVDVDVRPGASAPESIRIHPPQSLCQEPATPLSLCEPVPYEGRPVTIRQAVLRTISPAMARADEQRGVSLGVELAAPIPRAYAEESPLGNLFADLMREAHPDADVAITNSGGLRAHLPAGPLTYGALFEAMPFDNRFARVRLRGRQLARLLANNLSHDKGLLLISGLRAVAACEAGVLQVALHREDGRSVNDDETLSVITSDFLADGGDGAFSQLSLEPGAVTISDDFIRDAMVERLLARGGIVRPSDPALYDAQRLRVAYPGARPLRCPTSTSY